MIVASFGGGTDSTAMILGCYEKGERIDLILFADTGGEKPNTYEHIERFSNWLVKHGLPEVVIVRSSVTLEQDCITRKALPSIAYGFKTCSQRFKIQPQDKFMNNNSQAKATWSAGERVTKLIGYDASESGRAERGGDGGEKYINRYPLIDWGWDRLTCQTTIMAHGLPLPGKSACFFCPSSKAQEVLELKRKHPELMERALKMEAQADLKAVKGLGRDWAWADLVNFDESQAKLFDTDWTTLEVPCGCYDGE